MALSAELADRPERTSLTPARIGGMGLLAPGRMPRRRVHLAHRGRRGAGSQVRLRRMGGKYCVLVRLNCVGGLKRLASANGSVQALAPGLGSRLYLRVRTRRPPVAELARIHPARSV